MQSSNTTVQADAGREIAIIHKTAVVHPKAQLSKGVVIGPYCVVGEHVTLGEHAIIDSHVIIDGWTHIGDRCRIHSHSVIGGEPQDLKFRGGESYVEIGNDTVVREFVTINRGTKEGERTLIGNSNLLMAYVHVAHNCLIGNHVILANAATLGGHIIIEDHASIGGLSGLHQFVRVGEYSFVGGCSKVTQDVPPYLKVDGHPVAPHGLNSVGLRRHRFSSEVIANLKQAYKVLYRANLRLEDALRRIQKECGDSPEINHFVDFIRSSQTSQHHRGICR
jgi:UDP-N-acetylglucosamine acyltransferase